MEQDPSTVEKVRLTMQGRLLRCPLGGNPEDCPLHEIRKLPLEERIAWLAAKSDQEVLELHRRHLDCMQYKLSFRST